MTGRGLGRTHFFLSVLINPATARIWACLYLCAIHTHVGLFRTASELSRTRHPTTCPSRCSKRSYRSSTAARQSSTGAPTRAGSFSPSPTARSTTPAPDGSAAPCHSVLFYFFAMHMYPPVLPFIFRSCSSAASFVRTTASAIWSSNT